MKFLLSTLKISINDKIYLKDPESSDLGKRIIEHSIKLIDKIGFDSFTFKKLGALIGSNESSIYRYFDSKHKLLLYLASWYWAWLEYQLVFSTTNMNDSKLKLEKAIDILTQTIEADSTFEHIDEVTLNRVVINEYSKSYLTKEVDIENKEGYFSIYKRLLNRLHDMIIEVDPSYKFPHSLSSTIVEGALHQHFLKDHFKSLTDCDHKTQPSDYFKHLVFNALNTTPND
ncbi:TetR/AcrR family transcriptional regulator [Psychroserpens sp.]|uniref:TetR/AcrR family transcriptional regulator n=1 Tax=Psychroserpens sp. TaxID=2020870 RepID=UPI001B1BCC4E|nr:TetR/AcrR family transcriptional regulator [Psychroserpens sp.]MBO6606501.1 TetR/AcrR family transcriptional regulator [Psychroserpens sp.]MBO6630412.1 TetR/AcrR family transcriptional regulator [Psychroserpens sp.]MBO6653205.1 TetR/AcrR family transcriptional regulator [Psychroserpens sp.]MBO6680767.1 TetR/AcrR family transcriptional regulator [Psychroserpens sp.]MBO6750275.1 TetR/AcrR family transcriptional regulator [Psychroserpens sp.]